MLKLTVSMLGNHQMLWYWFDIIPEEIYKSRDSVQNFTSLRIKRSKHQNASASSSRRIIMGEQRSLIPAQHGDTIQHLQPPFCSKNQMKLFSTPSV